MHVYFLPVIYQVTSLDKHQCRWWNAHLICYKVAVSAHLIMPTQTILYIIGSGILALFIALFQYIYKSKRIASLEFSRSEVHFVFSLLLLVINPKFENKESKIIKPVLAVVVDNSQSVKYLNKDSVASKAVQSLLKH